jgi:hypothetical protein
VKLIAVLLLASLPVPRVQTAPRLPTSSPLEQVRKSDAAAPRSHGKWYFAQSGHAVYCYGPVMTLTDVSGHIEHVATFCRGNRLMVPLRD